MLGLTRRQLVNGLSLAAAAAAVWWLLPQRSRPAAGAESRREQDLWSDLVGESFALAAGPGSSVGALPDLRLEEVKLCTFDNDRCRPTGLRRAAISLLFSATAATEFAAATYTVAHAKLGTTRLYMHRTVRADYPESAIYEAVLN
jgi:hypothetical protein